MTSEGLETIRQRCECSSWRCHKHIDLAFDDAYERALMPTVILIVDGCPHGPDREDELMAHCVGYSLYYDHHQRKP